jgi:hypothetical protein
VRGAARRIVLLFGASIVVIAVVSALIGLALGGSASRSAATGLYLVGSDERSDARATAWLFLAVGITMILVGIVLDPRTRLF